MKPSMFGFLANGFCSNEAESKKRGYGCKAVELHLIDWPISIPVNIIAISFFSTFIIGIFFGVYPAKKAANLDPIKALQFE